jgi:protein O-mannosyl-transferase
MNKITMNNKGQAYKVFREYLPLAGILIVFLLVYWQVMGFGLLDWDDDGYITNVPDIHSFNLSHFFTSFYLGNYHPLTCLSWALDYSLWKLNGTGYHLTNLLFHTFNIVLVYLLIRELFDRKDLALAVAALFAFHPMHVESIAWVSERKDVLYAFFFLAALLSYLKFLKSGKTGFYFATLLLFILALLSKSAALVFPLILLLTDYFRGIRFNTRNILLKLPFFALSLLFGYITLNSQYVALDYPFTPHYPWPGRIFIASWSTFWYVQQLFLPLKLSALHPYPTGIHEPIPLYMYLSVLLFILAGLAIFLIKKHRKLLLLGMGFFMVNLLMVIQLVPAGKAIVAERYAYLPYLGIYVILSWFILNSSPKLRRYLLILGGLWMIYLLGTTYTRLPAWKDNDALFSDIISKNPREPVGYYNRGLIRLRTGNLREAFEDYSQCLRLDPENRQALWNRSLVLMRLDDPAAELDDLDRLLRLDPLNMDAWKNHAMASATLGDYKSTEADFSYMLQKFPDDTSILLNRGVTYLYLDDKGKACGDFQRAMKLGSRRAETFYSGNCLDHQ